MSRRWNCVAQLTLINFATTYFLIFLCCSLICSLIFDCRRIRSIFSIYCHPAATQQHTYTCEAFDECFQNNIVQCTPFYNHFSTRRIGCTVVSIPACHVLHSRIVEKVKEYTTLAKCWLTWNYHFHYKITSIAKYLSESYIGLNHISADQCSYGQCFFQKKGGRFVWKILHSI